jgi:hypothetical protein
LKFKIKTSALVLLAIFCLTILIISVPKSVRASQSTSTLADYLNSWLNNTTFDDSPLATQWGIVFGDKSIASYDITAQDAVDAQRWTDVFLIKRSAEISGYASPVLDSAVRTALQNCPKVGALPATYYGIGWLVYDGFALWAPKWAGELGVAGWNATEMFNQLKYFVDVCGGGFLVAYENYASYSPQGSTRYYDEQAETLRAFVILARQGVEGAMSYADKIWNHLNSDGWWTGQWYWYRPNYQVFECEMGGFAMIISDYLGYVHPNIISDLETKLLAQGWDSPCWQNNGSKYVINHANQPDGTPATAEMRPAETLAVWRALQSVYRSMPGGDQEKITNMLSGSAWYNTITSGAFDKGPTQSASARTAQRVTGAAVMFLMGIIPETGSLNLGYREEGYITNTEIINSNNFAFDYSGRRIRISLFAGSLGFNFGTTPVLYSFNETGVYDVYFSNDWNTVIEANYLGWDNDTIQVYPKAILTYEPLYYYVNMTMTFNATSSKLGWNGTTQPPIVDYRWDFGDGNITEGDYPTITHVYTTLGKKTAELTITDADGNQGYTQQTFEITYQIDLNGDRIFDIYDAVMFAHAFNTVPANSNWNPRADLNGDGTVDVYDAVLLASYLQRITAHSF